MQQVPKWFVHKKAIDQCIEMNVHITNSGRTHMVPLRHVLEGKYYLHAVEWMNLIHRDGLKKCMSLTFKYDDRVQYLALRRVT